VMEVDYSDLSAVDEKLMRLAVEAKATLATVDYNLTQVARVRGIEVVNLNEAAAALRPNFLPGDGIRIQITRAGKAEGQGVGYLEDGTMVVVEEGRQLIGTEAEVEVSSVLQTSGGRMIFARTSSAPEQADE
ncbi:MAG: TRAM domain-containing protein, partial [Actinobacteria bacterium]